MSDFFSVYIYFALVGAITGLVLLASNLVSPKKDIKIKYLPYDPDTPQELTYFNNAFHSAITWLLSYFSSLTSRVIFLYPWAVVAKRNRGLCLL